MKEELRGVEVSGAKGDEKRRMKVQRCRWTSWLLSVWRACELGCRGGSFGIGGGNREGQTRLPAWWFSNLGDGEGLPSTMTQIIDTTRYGFCFSLLLSFTAAGTAASQLW